MAELELDSLLGRIDQEWSGVQRKGDYYSREGDCLFYFNESVPYVAERVDAFLTAYRAIDAGRIVGFELKGLHSLGIEEIKATVSTGDGDHSHHIVELLLRSLVGTEGETEAEVRYTRVRAYQEAIETVAKAA